MTRLLPTIALMTALSSVAKAGDPEVMKWTIGPDQREALVYAPAKSADANAKAPVILYFHGHGGNMRVADRGMHFQEQWPEAIVVYLQGLPTPGIVLDKEGTRPGWQNHAGSQNDRDLKFVDAVLLTLHEKFPVDDRRIYASGYSNGGLFTYLLWSQRPNVFAAFAPGGAVILPSVKITEPRPVLHYAGENDRIAPFEKQQRTIDQLRELNGCAATGESCGTFCTLYPSRSGAPVETLIGPGGHMDPPRATDAIVAFFKDHPGR